MIRKSRWWISWLSGAMIIAAAAGTFFFLKDIHPLGSMSVFLGKNELEGISFQFENAQLVGRSQGRKIWLFGAKKVEVSADRRYADFEGVTEGKVLKDDKVVASVSADKVVYDTVTKNVRSPETATLEIVDGPTFKFREVFWDSRNSRLTCTGGADAELAGGTMHCENMVADVEKKEITAYKVSGTIPIDETGGLPSRNEKGEKR